MLTDRSVDPTLGWVVGPRHTQRLGGRGQRVLARLAASAGRVVPADALAEPTDGPRTLSGVVRRLRTRIEPQPGAPRHLHTVFGKGYRLDLLPDPACQVPPRADPFVGREALARSILDAPDRQRVLTLVGMGGMGKTRLADRMGRLLRHRYAGGVRRVDLSACRTGADVELAMLRTLPPSTRPLADRLHELGRVLLLLDNVEQVHRVVREALQQWLPRAPGLRVLATSRRPIGCAAERCITVGPLSPAHSRKLLALHSGRPTTDTELLVGTLDGHPLSIEVVGARSRRLPPQLVAAQLAADGRLGGLPRRGVPTHQQTLRASLSWSWELLGPAERAALSGATVFSGSFSLFAAERVMGSAARALPALVEHSLLQQRQQTTRFGMLTLVRAFALEQPETKAGQTKLRLAHARYFSEHPAARIDLDDLRAAIGFAVDAAEVDLGVALFHRLLPAVGQHGPPRLGAMAARPLLGLSLPPPDRARIGTAITRWELAAGRSAQAAEVLDSLEQHAIPEIELHQLRGELAQARGRLPQALAAFRAAQAVTTPGSDAWLRARVWSAEVLEDQGRLDDATAIRDTLVDAIAACSDPPLRLRAWLGAGYLAATRGDLDGAARAYAEAEALQSDGGDALQAIHTRARRADLAVRAGRLDDAARWGEEVVRALRQLGHHRRAAAELGNLTRVHRQRGDLDRASAVAEEALALHEAHGDDRAAAVVLGSLGAIDLTAGRLDQARDRFEAAIARSTRAADSRHVGIALLNLAMVHAQQGHPEHAKPLLQQAAVQHAELGDAVHEGIALGNLGELQLQVGELSAARASLTAAMDRLSPRGHPAAGAFAAVLAHALAQSPDPRPEAVPRLLRRAHSTLASLPIERARAWCRNGQISLLQGDFDAASEALDHAQQLAGQADPRSTVSRQIAALAAALAATR